MGLTGNGTGGLMKKLIITLKKFILIALFLLFTIPTWAGETVTQSQLNATGNGEWIGNNVYDALCQGFQVSTTDPVTRFTLEFNNYGSGTGNLVGYIYNASGSNPGTAVATFSTLDVSAISAYPTYVEYSFTGTFIPTINTQYYMVAIWDNPALGQYIDIQGDLGNPYPNGVIGRRAIGLSWVMYTDNDAYFKVWQTPVSNTGNFFQLFN